MSEIKIQLPWERMSPNMRNFLIGDLIGAEKLGQYHVFIGEKQFLPLPCIRGEAKKANQMYHELVGNSWEEFAFQHGLPNAARDLLEVKLVEWHQRYSDTHGGGWAVIEAIRARKFDIIVLNWDGGWRVSASSTGGQRHEATASTMAEAACLVARQCIEPTPLTPAQTAELAKELTDEKPMYVIYDHPPDYPKHVVVRVWKALKPTDDVSLWNSLEEARGHLPKGLTIVASGQLPDAEKVKEVWA